MAQRILSGGRFLGSWILLLIALVLLSEATAPVFPEMRARRALLTARAADVEAISLGNSHAGALDFSVLGVDGFHLSNGAMDIHEAAFLTDELLPSLPAVRCVLVSLSPYYLVYDNAVLRRLSLRRELYVRTLSLKFISGDIRPFVAGKLAPLVREDHWKGVLAALVQQGSPPTRVGADGAREPQRASSMPSDSLLHHAIARARRHEGQRREVLASRADAKDAGFMSLVRIVERSAEHGASVLLYTPPYFRPYLNQLEDEALRDVRTAALSLANTYGHVEYADYSTNPAFHDVPMYFRNSDHLNEMGSREFSRMLRDDVSPGRSRDCFRSDGVRGPGGRDAG